MVVTGETVRQVPCQVLEWILERVSEQSLA
jgi:hypothetical protein